MKLLDKITFNIFLASLALFLLFPHLGIAGKRDKESDSAPSPKYQVQVQSPRSESEDILFHNQMLLDIAKELRHHLNSPCDVVHAEGIFEGVIESSLALLNTLSSNPINPSLVQETKREISEAYLGLAKINDRLGQRKKGAQLAKNSLLHGNPNDLRTVVWLAKNSEIPLQHRAELAEKILNLNESDLTPNDRPFLDFAKASAHICMGYFGVDEENHLRHGLKYARKAGYPDLIVQAYSGFGNFFGARGRNQEALENFQKAYAIKPNAYLVKRIRQVRYFLEKSKLQATPL